MDIGAIFLIVALTILVGLFVARPFIEHRRLRVVSAEEKELSSLMAERDRMINALQELDFDYTLGKIPAEDYPSQRAALLQHAADALRRLDEHTPQSSFAEDAESRIEAVIASRRADAAVTHEQPAETVSDEDLESMLAARRSERKEKSGGFCPSCGKPVLRSDRFCPSCGGSIK